MRGVGYKKAEKALTKFTQTNNKDYALNKENIRNISHLKLVIMGTNEFCAIPFTISPSLEILQSPSPAALMRYL